jgi:hypothetical protein
MTIHLTTHQYKQRYLFPEDRTVCGAVCTDGSFAYVGTTGLDAASVSEFIVSNGVLLFSTIS